MLVVGGDFGDFLPASFFFHLPEHPIDRNFGNTFCPYLICPICPKASKELMSKKKGRGKHRGREWDRAYVTFPFSMRLP